MLSPELKLRSRNGSNAFEEVLNLPKKASLDKRQCKCSGKCDTNRCGCKKNGDKCSENCICNATLCCNKYSQEV